MLSTALQASAVVVLSLPASGQPAANARPAGGVVVAGAAAISRSASNTRIDQASQRAAIDWKSFDVGSAQSVTFAQPSASAVALNRVTGPDPSRIAGRIDANGQIVLVNQSGVNFYQGAQVNAAGVMVSTANISNTNFMAGVMKFDQPGKADARIDNAGTIMAGGSWCGPPRPRKWTERSPPRVDRAAATAASPRSPGARSA
jgi:filamentous hemagglutinin family protein